MGKFEDLTGQRFGRLVVLNRGEDKIFPSGGREIRWWCQCECGSKPKLIYGKYLKNGKTTSCGCYNSELITGRNKTTKKKYNTYDLSGEYGIGYTSKGEEFWFDLEDYNKIKDYCWMIDPKGYVVDRDSVKLHRIVLNLTSDNNELLADHIHGENSRYDNRKSNLRVANHSQNGMNVGLQVNNTSSVTGVSWHSRDKVWNAYITVQGKTMFLGCFNNFDNAVKARKDAERKYFGEFSYDYSQQMEV